MTRFPYSWRIAAISVLVGIAIIGSVFLVLEPTIAILAMTYVIPFTAALAVTLFRTSSIIRSTATESRNWFDNPFILMISMATFIMVEVLSIYARLTSDERIFAYFGLQGFAILFVCIQVFLCRIDGGTVKILILNQIGVLVALEIALKTLPLPYYTGNSDIILHELNVRGITESGFVGPFMGNYEFVPVFHVLSSIAYSSSNLLSYQDAILIISSVVGYALPFVFYSILGRLGASGRHAMFFALIAPLSYSLLFILSIGVAALITFMFLLLYLQVSFSTTRGRRMSVLVLVFAFAMITSHQVSIPVYVVVLFTTLMVWGRSRGFRGLEMRERLRPVLMLAVVYVAYHSYYLLGFYSGILSHLEFTSDVWVPDTSQVTLTDNYVRNFVIVNAPFSALLFLAFLGWLSYAKSQSHYLGKRISSPLFILGSIAFVTYIPGLSSLIRLIEEYLTVGGRNILIAEQLVIWFVVLALFRQYSISALRGRVTLTCIVAIILLGSVMSQSNTLDTSAMDVLNPRSSTHFIDSELASFSFVSGNVANQPIFTDFVSSRYINSNGGLSANPHILYDTGVLFPMGSTVLLRTGELSSSPLYFYASEHHILVVGFVSVNPVDVDQTVRLSNVIYSSGSVEILILESDLFLGA